MHFIFKKCPIYTHDDVSAKFTDYGARGRFVRYTKRSLNWQCKDDLFMLIFYSHMHATPEHRHGKKTPFETLKILSIRWQPSMHCSVSIGYLEIFSKLL